MQSVSYLETMHRAFNSLVTHQIKRNKKSIFIIDAIIHVQLLQLLNGEKCVCMCVWGGGGRGSKDSFVSNKENNKDTYDTAKGYSIVAVSTSMVQTTTSSVYWQTRPKR